eukprot:jgi/Chlat1/165/Chrsp1S03104
MPASTLADVCALLWIAATSNRLDAFYYAPKVKEDRAPIVLLPGFLNSSATYFVMSQHLQDLGFHVYIVPIRSDDWCSTLFGASFSFYLKRTEEVLKQVYRNHGEQKVNLVGHSAGGWLARILMGERVYDGEVYGHAGMVASLLTLGTPHLSNEKYPFGRVPERRRGEEREGLPDEARSSSLQYANFFYPDDFFVRQSAVRCVGVCGRSIQGRSWRLPQLIRGLSGEEIAYTSYQVNCGVGNVWGDGVCPVESTLLNGWEHLVLPGVRHAGRGPTSGEEVDEAKKPWYGTAQVVSEWSQYLL